MKTSQCKQCKKALTTQYRKRATGLCFKCYMTGSNNHAWVGGMPKCIDCNMELTNRRPGGRCKKCYHKFYRGKNTVQWLGGKSRLPKCKICHKKLATIKSRYCKQHIGKLISGKNNWHWVKKLNCKECGKQLHRNANLKGTIYCKNCLHLGSRSHHWRGGITPKNLRIRNSLKYRIWRGKCFKRDNWTCQNCSYRGKGLEVDHIKPFCLFPRLRFTIKNGRTLCKDCHNLLGWRNRKH